MTKKPSTLQKYHLKPSIFDGKNTLEVARIIAEIFTLQFGCQGGTKDEILKTLLPKGRANTWSNLDKHINLFCKQFYQKYEQNAKEIQFLDNVRYILEDLPQRQKYRLPESKEEYPTAQATAEHFITCSLCWRSVAQKPLEKKTPLCHIHDLPSSSNEYRRRARMKVQVVNDIVKLTKSLPTLWEIKRSGQNLNEYLKGLCLNPESPLPYLVKYLQSLNLPLETEKDILQALEYPVYYHKIPLHIKEAWDFYMEDRSKHFKLNYIKLLTAEAWLQADAERKHGGRRR